MELEKGMFFVSGLNTKGDGLQLLGALPVCVQGCIITSLVTWAMAQQKVLILLIRGTSSSFLSLSPFIKRVSIVSTTKMRTQGLL